jgi:ornithine cyclodeaminase
MMVRVVTVDDIQNLVRKVTLNTFFKKLIERLEYDYSRWHEFEKIPRIANHYPFGVIELMPTSDDDYYAFKYVNGHPLNPGENKQTVVATGMLADVATGYPVMMSEMTMLTALRTAATSVLASKYLARKDSTCFGLVGTGAQSEFQLLAHKAIFDITDVYYFDTDPAAMKKFGKNMASQSLRLHPCKNAEDVAKNSDIITTATAAKYQAIILELDWVRPGTHINGVGGDCPGKTEMDPAIMEKAKIVVELFEQTKHEGEIQNGFEDKVHAELWELVDTSKKGRETDEEITLFDSVGFALEDYSVLRLVYGMVEEFHIGHIMDMVPDMADPKDLYSVCVSRTEHVG